MALIHELFFVKLENVSLLNQELLYDNLMENIEMTECKIMKKIAFSDDIFGYFEDVLAWISVSTPVFPEIVQDNGLKRYGISIVDRTSYVTICDIVEGLKKIVHTAPEDILLTGNYVISSDGYGCYEKIKLKKGDVLKKIEDINDVLHYLKEDSYYLIHFGI